MNLVVDTSVWSRVLRRRKVDATDPWVLSFRNHVDQGDGLHLLGMILQELLDGVESPADFERLVKLMTPFPLVPATRETHILASRLRNQCRKKGVQASPVDFLIAAACIENGYPLLSSDRDFSYIARHCDLMLLEV